MWYPMRTSSAHQLFCENRVSPRDDSLFESAVALIVCLLNSWRKKKGEMENEKQSQEVRGPQTARQALPGGISTHIWPGEDPLDHPETDSGPVGANFPSGESRSSGSCFH